MLIEGFQRETGKSTGGITVEEAFQHSLSMADPKGPLPSFSSAIPGSHRLRKMTLRTTEEAIQPVY